MTSYALFFADTERLGIGGSGSGFGWAEAAQLGASLFLVFSLLMLCSSLWRAAKDGAYAFLLVGLTYVLILPVAVGWLVVLKYLSLSGAGIPLALLMSLVALQMRNSLRWRLDEEQEEAKRTRRSSAQEGARKRKLQRSAKRDAERDLDSLKEETETVRAALEVEKELFPESLEKLAASDELSRARAELAEAREELERLRAHQPMNHLGEPLGS